MQRLYCAALPSIACQGSVEGILESNREHHMSQNLHALPGQTPLENLIRQHSNLVQLVLRVLLAHGTQRVRPTISFVRQIILRKFRC